MVDEVQTTSIAGRNIQDGPRIVNEIFSWKKKGKEKIVDVQGGF